MTRPPLSPAASRSVRLAGLVAALAVGIVAEGLVPGAPLAAQATFDLPPATPTPTPAPAGPADERAGVAIPPRAVPTATPAATPAATPSPTPTLTTQRRRQPLPDAAPAPLPRPAARAGGPVPSVPASPALPSLAPTPLPGPSALPEETQVPSGPSASPSGEAPPLASAPAATAATGEVAGTGAAPAPLPRWWPFAAGGLGALALLGGAALLWWRRMARPLRLAAPAHAAAQPAAAAEPARLDLTLEITAATRSVMMFTLEYRLTIANRSPRAVSDCHAAVQLACARASAGTGAGGAPSAGAAQRLETIARIGPHQARSIGGRVQLPLSAIAPLRQGQTPLFIPLVHVTLEGEGLPAHTRSFVIGKPSASGRVHPIALDQPPGGIAGLVAQGVTVPAANAAA